MNLFQSLICVLNGFAQSTRAMTVPSVLFFVSLIIVLGVSQANAQQKNGVGQAKKPIKCYVCNSARDPRCGDPFDTSTTEMVDCEQFMPDKNSSFFCRKNVQRVTFGSRADYRVIRTCGYIPETPRYGEDQVKDRCYKKAGTFEVEVTYCSCYSDGCNPAPRSARCSLSFMSQTGLQIATIIVGSYLMLKDRNNFY